MISSKMIDRHLQINLKKFLLSFGCPLVGKTKFNYNKVVSSKNLVEKFRYLGNTSISL